VLSFPLIDRTRRNHGLEHATITLLSQKFRGVNMMGRSTPNGFYLYGAIPTDALAEAAEIALRRMKAGEHHLAVHPNCGTNFVTAGIAAGLAAYLGFLGASDSRSRFERMPMVVIFTTLALIVAQPLGLILQRDITTSGDMRGLEIAGVARRRPQGGLTVHFVTTRG
jgi:hypothetical protein